MLVMHLINLNRAGYTSNLRAWRVTTVRWTVQPGPRANTVAVRDLAKIWKLVVFECPR